MHLGLFVCVSVRLRNSQTILPFDLIFYTTIIMPVTRPSKIIRIWTLSIIYLWIHHNWEIGQNMPSKYVTMSNLCFDENMRYDVTNA